MSENVLLPLLGSQSYIPLSPFETLKGSVEQFLAKKNFLTEKKEVPWMI